MVRTADRRRPALHTTISFVALWALGLLGLLSAPPAAAAEPCVGVVVDARLLGGDVRTGCAKGDPDSGLDAMTAAGFRYSFAPRLPGFVCQIDATPECSRTGSTTYWSYWYRTKGSRTWVYSPVGAGAHDPAPGSTEAWVWQDGGRREPPDVALTTICPQLATQRARSKTPAASPSPVRASEDAAAAGPSALRTTSKATVTSAPPAPTSVTSPTPTSVTSPSPTGTSTTTTAATDRAGDDSRWTGLVLGGGLVAALGAAAVARSRRTGGGS